MGLRHFSYVAMLAFCLCGALPLVPIFRLDVVRQLPRLAVAVLLGGAPFLLWDVLATRAGHWRFDASQTLPGRVAGLPYEEVAFFAVIPVVAVLTYEGVQAALRRVAAPDGARTGGR